MPEDKNIYINTTPVPGTGSKCFNIFIFKKEFRDALIRTLSGIASKISEQSDLKPVAVKLSDTKSWVQNKPKRIPSFPADTNKWFCELTLEEIATFKKIFFKYKTKFASTSRLLVGSDEVQTGTQIINMIKGLVGESDNQLFDKRLNAINRQKEQSKKEEFKQLALKKLNDRYTSIIEAHKKAIEELNKFLPLDETWPKKITLPTSTDAKQTIIKIFDEIDELTKKLEIKKRTTNGLTEKEEELLNLLLKWLENIGAKINSTLKIANNIQQCLEYKIIDFLGTGASAVVVKVLTDKGQERALKIFNQSDDRDNEIRAINLIRQKFGSVKSNGQSTKSPLKKYFNAPKVNNDGTVQMRLANKVLDSDEFLNRGNKKSGLTIVFFQKCARNILKGLFELHRRELVHGDIKPDNIHLTSDKIVKEGSKFHGRFKIADVGTVHDNDQPSELIGSQVYMHPDLRRSSSLIDKQKNDVYALGCSLLDILCGKRVLQYIGFDTTAVLGEVLHDFTDPSMNKDSILQLLDFISNLCKPKLDSVPTADAALRLPFVQK